MKDGSLHSSHSPQVNRIVDQSAGPPTITAAGRVCAWKEKKKIQLMVAVVGESVKAFGAWDVEWQLTPIQHRWHQTCSVTTVSDTRDKYKQVNGNKQ